MTEREQLLKELLFEALENSFKFKAYYEKARTALEELHGKNTKLREDFDHIEQQHLTTESALLDSEHDVEKLRKEVWARQAEVLGLQNELVRLQGGVVCLKPIMDHVMESVNTKYPKQEE